MNNPCVPDFFRPLLTILLVMAFSVLTLAQEKPTMQLSFNRDTGQAVKLDLLSGQAKVLEFAEPFDTAVTSENEVADVTPLSQNTLVISGKKFGQINVVIKSRAAKGEPSQIIILDVYVQNNLTQIDNQIKILFPKENIQLSQANDSVVISGSVTRPDIAVNVKEILVAAGFKNVTSLIKPPVTDTLQVELQIRVAEVNRQVLREIGASYASLTGTGIPTFISPNGPASFGGYSEGLRNLGNGGPLGGNNDVRFLRELAVSPSSVLNLFFGGSNQFFIRALQERGALRTLSEPVLTAANKATASFLSGGEFPYTVINTAGGGGGITGVTVQFKPYGIQLKFTPTIIDENHIQLVLEPEVSSLDFSSASQISGNVVPGLRVRRAQTSVELRDGQSFALAGLIDNTEQVNLAKIPGIGDIPILGELFKSRRFQRNETELLFVCTVKLVEPLNPDQYPVLPGVGTGRTPTPPANLNPAGVKPSGLIEGDTGHAPPARKVGEASKPAATKPADKPETSPEAAPAPIRIEKTVSENKPPKSN